MTTIDHRAEWVRATCGRVSSGWPPPPVSPSRWLTPITSWREMWEEIPVTGVEFDAHWLDLVESRVAYFFRWTGTPRATVLVVWSDDEIRYVECRGQGDRKLCSTESLEIVVELHRLFVEAGFAIVVEGTAPH